LVLQTQHGVEKETRVHIDSYFPPKKFDGIKMYYM
jgi:hypothetical protein